MIKKGKRIGAIVLAITLAVTTLFNGITFNNNEAKAAEVPESIKMPIVIYDHLADGLLFEYDLYDSVANKLSLESSSFFDVTGAIENGQGLIENELGENGTPIYKEEVVERVAEIVKEYLEKEETVDIDLYNQLVSQIVKTKGSEKIILGPEVYELDLNQLGWSFANASYVLEDGDDYWKDAEGNVLWYRDGDWLHTNGGVDNKAVFDFGNLEAGEYELTYYNATNVNVVISYNGNTVDITNSGTKFELTTAANVTLTVSAKDDNVGNLTAPNLKDSSGEKIYNNFTKPQDQKISKLGWVFDADSSWTNSEWGGIKCDHGEETDIYYVQEVIPGKTYGFECHNENDLLSITVTDMNGNKIGEGEEKFTIPTGINQVKIVLSCACDETETKTIRFDDLVMKEYPDVTLGDYATSKEKFSKGAKLTDVSSCMDYAYYMLNNFWTDTNGDITQKTDIYNAIKLNLNDKYYNFSTDNKVNYDLKNGEISEDTSNDTHIGFFPLDTTLLGDKSDLAAPFGVGSDMYNQYDEMNHNYHFAMKVHCEFLYKESDELLFKFNGDDDVYLFIDNKLVLDIGGAHEKKDGYVDVNEVAQKIGLEEGEIYTFDFFYMERHTTASNLTIETNMILEQAEAKPTIIYKDENGNVIEDGAEVPVSEEVGIEYTIQAGNDGMSDITFNDEKLDVLIGKEGIDLGDEGVYVKDKIVVTVYDADGNVKETYSIDKEDLDNQEKVDAFAETIGDIVINTGESVTVSGIYKEADYDEFESDLHVDITAPLRQYGDNGTIVTITEVITVIPVTSAITTVPKAYPYTVKYVDKATGAEIADKKTSEANYKYDVTEKAIDITGYTLDDTAEKSITIGKSGNEIVFEYEKNKVNVEFKADANGTVTGELNQTVEIDEKVASVATPVPDEGYEFNGWVKTTTDGTIVSENPADEVITEDTVFTANFTPMDCNYVVKYVDKETGKELVASKTGEATFGTDVTENAVSIEGYTLTSDAEKQITIKVSGNEIIFEYEINKFNVEFKADENGSVEGELSQTVNYKDTVSSVATPVPNKGYEFLGWEKTTSDGTIISEKPGEEVITEDTVFTAKFGPLDYGYVVKYVDEEGNALLPETLGEETTFGTKVSAEAAEIPGYTVDEANKSIVIDTENNEIVFVYAKKVYDVIFKTDGNGTIEGTSEMKVKYEETIEEVPGNTANEGYSFTGWTMVSGDGEEVVVEDPATVKITDNTVFTAHYEINSYDYVIKYVDEDGNSISPDVVKSAVYGTTVTETPITIDGYTTKDGDKSIVIKVEGNEIVFVYAKDAEDDPSDRDVNVKDAKDENNENEEGYGYGKKTKGDDDSKDNDGKGNGKQNNGTVSPKTGNSVVIYVMIGSMMMAFMCALYSLLKLRKYRTR